MSFTRVEAAIDAITRGEFVVVVDDEDRENEGDLIIAAEKMTPEKMAFMIRYTSGVICLPMEGARLDELQLPLMVAGPDNSEQQRTAFTVSVDAKVGTTTGISAADRSTTVHAVIDPSTQAEDLARPGHIFPLRYREGGVLKRAGHTEAAIDLARMAGLLPGRRARGDRERRRHDAAHARPRGVRRGARARARHHRGPDPVPPAPREAGAAGLRSAHPDQAR